MRPDQQHAIRATCSDVIDLSRLAVGTPAGDVAALANVTVSTELVAFGCRHDQLTYRVVCCPLRPGELPDDGALRCAGGDVGATTVVHSTSWRFEPPHGWY